MANQYNKSSKVHWFEVGQLVGLQIPSEPFKAPSPRAAGTKIFRPSTSLSTESESVLDRLISGQGVFWAPTSCRRSWAPHNDSFICCHLSVARQQAQHQQSSGVFVLLVVLFSIGLQVA
ncbi:hypothetical protein WJX77_003206 [Trebouxia sp. C0004]